MAVSGADGSANYLKVNAVRALRWFVVEMGEEEWVRRKRRIVEAFHENMRDKLTSPLRKEPPKSFDDYARFSYEQDRIAWYMYLMENWEQRPECDEPLQSARIGPFFAAIGEFMSLLKNAKNLDTKLHELLRTRCNDPDSLLFELLIAICYLRNSYSVEFILEDSRSKKPDLMVSKGEDTFYVECKRLAKLTGYAEIQREARRKLWMHLGAAMRQYRVPVYAELVYLLPYEDVHEDSAARAFVDYVNDGKLDSREWLVTDELQIKAEHIDMQRIHSHFEDWNVRFSSPQLTELFCGPYDPFGDYTTAIAIKSLGEVGPENDPEYAYNAFVGDVHGGFAAKWECIAEASMSKRAKDVRTLLSKAVKQVPEDQPSIIHIGYETLHGPEVECVRQQKIDETIGKFDFNGKPVSAVFCHSFQPVSLVENFDCAETTIYYGWNGYDPLTVLPMNMLLLPLDCESREGTHWHEDMETKYGDIRF